MSQPGIGNVRNEGGIALRSQPVDHIGKCRCGKAFHFFHYGRVDHRREERAGAFQGGSAVGTVRIVQGTQDAPHFFLLLQVEQQGQGKAPYLGIVAGFDQGTECPCGFFGIGRGYPFQVMQKIVCRSIGHHVKGSHGSASGKGLPDQGKLLFVAGLGQAHQQFFRQRGSQPAQTGNGLGP